MTFSSGGQPPSSVTVITLGTTIDALRDENEELACEVGEAVHAAQHVADALERARADRVAADLGREEAESAFRILNAAIAPFEEMARALLAVRTEADDTECIRRTPTGADTSHELTIGHCRALVAAIDRMKSEKEPK